MAVSEPKTASRRLRARRLLFAALPLVLLGALVVVVRIYGPGSALRTGFPPVEELTFQRVVLRGSDGPGAEPKVIVVHAVNSGPSETTIAQVIVDEAYWPFEIHPRARLARLESAIIWLEYPWVEGEAHEIKLITSTGLTFGHEVEVAVATPRADARYLGIFSLLGVYVGVVPVFLGLLWFPALRDASQRWMGLLLSLTVGLLVFLAVDATHEALEAADELPRAFGGVGLVVAGVAGSWLLLAVISRWSRRIASQRGEAFQRLVLAYTTALGIGLHNLGEGLAIGTAYAVGNIALGGLLVIGFAVHNTTEGFAIVAPVARERVRVRSLVWMGLLAGAPTILGAWLGAFTYSAVWSVVFLSVGAGAIGQVVYAILAHMARQAEAGWLTGRNFVGLAAGFMLMYATSLLVAF
jgi:zinc transporter ZupT